MNHTHTAFSDEMNVKQGTEEKKIAHFIQASMFPAAIFHSILLNFHRNDGVFVQHLFGFFCTHLKIAKRENAFLMYLYVFVYAYFPILMKHLIRQLKFNAFPMPMAIFFLCIENSVYQSEHVGKLFYLKLTNEKWRKSKRYKEKAHQVISSRWRYIPSTWTKFMSDSDGCKSIYITKETKKLAKYNENPTLVLV